MCQFRRFYLDYSLIGLFLFFLIGLNHSIYEKEPIERLEYQDQNQPLNPLLYQILSFGQLPVVIDWEFILVLMDPSLKKVKWGERAGIYYQLDLISELDPGYFEVYYGGANLLSVIRKDSLGARDLLMKGVSFLKKKLSQYPEGFREQYWSRAWTLGMTLGYVYLFQIGDMPQAAQAFKQAALLPNAPPFMLRLEKKLSQVGGEYEVGLKLLDFMLLSPKDERVKKELEIKKLYLSISYYLFRINQSFLEFLHSKKGYSSEKLLVSKHRVQYWNDFLRVSETRAMDPWGGRLYLDSQGKVTTSTVYESVFNLR